MKTMLYSKISTATFLVWFTVGFASFSVIGSQVHAQGSAPSRTGKALSLQLALRRAELGLILFVNLEDCHKCVNGFTSTLSCLMAHSSIKPVAMVEGQRPASITVFKRLYDWDYPTALDDSDIRSKLRVPRTTRIAVIEKGGNVILCLEPEEALNLSCDQILDRIRHCTSRH